MRHFSLYAAAMAALGISVSIYAAEPTTAEPTTKELMEQIDALKAKYVDGASVRDLASLWRTTEKAIESLLSRARKAFRATFTALCGTLGAEVP